MRDNRWLCIVALTVSLLLSNRANADCTNELKNVRPIGAGSFCVLAFCLYDAKLYAGHTPVDFENPFALKLEYRHSFSRDQLVTAGIDEMERLAGKSIPENVIAAWRDDMNRAFSDVSSGDSLCGVYLGRRGVRFYRNGVLSADINDPTFARAFFSIWLDPQTKGPTLRRKLLGATSPHSQ